MASRFLIQKKLEIVREASNFILNSSLNPKTIDHLEVLTAALHNYVIEDKPFKYCGISWIYPHYDVPSDERKD